ncbi:MAG: peptidase T [Thermoleophilia bacterium]
MTFSSPLAETLAEDLLERFQRYVRVDTQSSPETGAEPSTPGQLELGRMLVEELGEIGVEDAAMDDGGFVFATLPGAGPAVGLLAHTDTTPEVSGARVEPIVHRGYDGGVIELPRDGTVLDPAEMPVLAGKAGHDIVTASGDTLLGADDKAGVAAIMAAVAHLAAHPELPRPTLRIGFTPDEEIGEGAKRFDIERFGATCAYTLDGSQPGELQDESFSAIGITVTFTGVEVHPGLATGKLVNAARLAGRFLAALPPELSPEATADRQGFVHPYEGEVATARATVKLIARDFDDDLLGQHVALVRRTAEQVVADEPRARVEVVTKHQYSNMRRHLEAYPQVVEHAARAIRAEGLEVERVPIRGGTDGSILSARGLPTPNLFAGGHEFHSAREWASVQDMASAAAVVVRLAGEWAGSQGRRQRRAER